MKRVNLTFFLFIFEVLGLYGLLGYLVSQGLIYQELFFLLLCFAGLIFALFYGLQGSVAAVVGGVVLILYEIEGSILVFFSRHFLESGFFLSALLAVGFSRSNMERKKISTEISNQILNARVERLTVGLSQRDRALQEALHDVITDMESPRIMYHSLRRLEQVSEKETFFDEILYSLYTHCHVEKSGIYEFQSGGRFKRISSFGATSLPDVLKWKAREVPEILKVVTTEKEVIIPKKISNRFVMAVPIMSPEEQIQYIVLIEEIRFINLSESLINLLKISAFWIKSLIEERLYMEALLSYSAFPSVIAYRQDIATKFLKENLARYRKYRLPFGLLHIQGPPSEETAGTLSSHLRLYDEIYITGESEMILFLAMIAEEDVSNILKRLQKLTPAHHIKVVKDISKKHGR